MYALIFVVKTEIGTTLGIFCEKSQHIVLIKLCAANVFLKFLVIIVKFTAFAICGARFLRGEHTAHLLSRFSYCSTEKEILQDLKGKAIVKKADGKMRGGAAPHATVFLKDPPRQKA
jgi:hypothetical protein